MIPILAAQSDNFVELGIRGKHAERLSYAAQGPQRPLLAPQLHDLPFQVVYSLF